MNLLNLLNLPTSLWCLCQTLRPFDGAVLWTRAGKALREASWESLEHHGSWCVLLGNALAVATASSLWRIKQLWGQNTAGHDRHIPIAMDESGRHDHDSHYDSCLEGGVLWG